MKGKIAFGAVVCALFTLGGAVAVNGCGKSSSTSGGNAKFTVSNKTVTASNFNLMDLFINKAFAAASAKVDYLGLKIISVQLFQDNATSTNAIIWQNPACPTDGTTCSSAGLGTSGFFDLARATTTVNADINSQDHSIPAGSYKSIDIAFASAAEAQSGTFSFKSICWNDADQDASATATSADTKCGAYPNGGLESKFSSDLVIADGDSVTIDLGYDLSASGLVTNGAGCNGPMAPGSTDAELANGDCLQLSVFKFNPTVTKN